MGEDKKADDLAEFAYVRELQQIDAEIHAAQSDLRDLHKRRERLVTGKHDFKTYHKATRNFR